MGKFVLTIDKNYVSDWTIADAIRELLQNMLDQESLNQANKGTIQVEGDILYISNKTSKLEKSSLVLGGGTKHNDATTIGKFGEGYKLALLVLVRNGVKVVINNFHNKEIWTPTIKYVKQYSTELLVIHTSKFFVTSPANDNLTFQLSGINNIKDILDDIMLDKSKYKTIQDTPKGSILIGGERGNLYVGGLFVTKIETLGYSYDIKPEFLPLGRDRNLVSDFDILWVLGKLWIKAPNELLLKALTTKYEDTKYIDIANNHPIADTVVEQLADTLHNTVPVVDQTDVMIAKIKYGDNVTTTIVSPQVKSVTRGKVNLPPMVRVSIESLASEFFIQHKKQFTKTMLQDWVAIAKYYEN